MQMLATLQPRVVPNSSMPLVITTMTPASWLAMASSVARHLHKRMSHQGGRRCKSICGSRRAGDELWNRKCTSIPPSSSRFVQVVWPSGIGVGTISVDKHYVMVNRYRPTPANSGASSKMSNDVLRPSVHEQRFTWFQSIEFPNPFSVATIVMLHIVVSVP